VVASDRVSGGVGGRLREARERCGMTLRDIAAATRIPVAALQALERNEVSRLPGGIFGRAFVRAYSAHVGLDPEAMVRDFVAALPAVDLEAGRPRREPTEADRLYENQQQVAVAVVRLLAISFPLVLAVLYLGAAGRTPPARAQDPGAVSVPTSGAESPAFAPATGVLERADGAAVPLPIPAARSLSLTIIATGRARVAVVADGKRLFDRALEPGERRTLDVQDEVLLTASDGGMIDVSVNGGPATPLGRAGEEVTVRMTPSDVNGSVASR
jgi:transcriptional regulator with XRE-family HTH domain